MKQYHPDRQIVTLLLHDEQGENWELSLPVNCLCFVGNYRRTEGFNIDAMIALDGLRKSG